MGINIQPRRKVATGIGVLLISVVGTLVWFFWPAQPDLSGFNPAGMARLETAMWRNYYAKDWPALVGNAWKTARQEYGFSRWDSFRLAWHAGRAARAFQRNPTDQGTDVALIAYYRVVRQAAPSSFDAVQAAKLEAQWWRQRRELTPPKEWTRTMAGLTALVYGRNSGSLQPAAEARVSAMSYRDVRRKTELNDSEWCEVERQLCVAYRLLKAAVPESHVRPTHKTPVTLNPPLITLMIPFLPTHTNATMLSDFKLAKKLGQT